MRTVIAGETGDEFSVALTQLVTTAVSSFSVSNWKNKVRAFNYHPSLQSMGREGSGVFTTVWSPSVTFPLVGDEVREVVLEEHAGGRGVAPVVHLAAPEIQSDQKLYTKSISRNNTVCRIQYGLVVKK